MPEPEEDDEYEDEEDEDSEEFEEDDDPEDQDYEDEFLKPRKSHVDWKLFSVDGPARLRDLEGRIAVSVRLGV
ncbi:hypothetical protein ACLB2K_072797 [Fragaria x ananassa]